MPSKKILSPDIIAQVLDKSLLRSLSILMDIRQTDGLYELVTNSPHATNVIDLLYDEIVLWRSGKDTNHMWDDTVAVDSKSHLS